VADAIAATVELAQLADDLGYTRYWCAEHHGLRGVSNPCPEVMLAHLGSVTKRIRLGSGGVMLPYYSPFKVAEQFMMLEALFPNRIDLGVGRAPGGDMRTAQAVAAGAYNRGDIFPQQVADLLGLCMAPCPTITLRTVRCCNRKSIRVRNCGCSAQANSADCWRRNSASALRSRISSMHISGTRWRRRIASDSKPVRKPSSRTSPPPCS
jgi:luciferase family oxidoreductase group 1